MGGCFAFGYMMNLVAVLVEDLVGPEVRMVEIE